ncbi:MAG: DUF1214 domain-containing protein [Xanthobacteraceae bacterium]
MSPTVLYDSTIPYDLRFFQSLDRFVQREPWLERDKAMIDQLTSRSASRRVSPSILIQRRRKSSTEPPAKRISGSTPIYEAIFSAPYFDGSRWAVPVLPEVVEGLQTNFANPDSYPIDGRGVTYSYGFFSAKHLGTGQFYLMTIKDKDGQPFDGGATYRLNVPANAPVKLYWSATAYDRSTHALIRNVARASRASNSPGLRRNVDGSADVYFGPKAPGGKEANWVPTSTSGGFEILFRLYGPEKPLFDKTWVLPDIEKIAVQ